MVDIIMHESGRGVGGTEDGASQEHTTRKSGGNGLTSKYGDCSDEHEAAEETGEACH